jgi:hypothetical protein
MVHSAPPTSKHRRVERIIGAVLALVGLAVAAIAIIALNHPQGRSAVTSSRIPTGSESSLASVASKSVTKSASPSKSSSRPSVPARPALIVLNNSGRTGLASTAADRFRSGGWTVTSTGDFTGDILSTAAYYDANVPGAQAAAEALQRQYPAIHRVRQRFSGLPEAPIVVVLTTDYS